MLTLGQIQHLVKNNSWSKITVRQIFTLGQMARLVKDNSWSRNTVGKIEHLVKNNSWTCPSVIFDQPLLLTNCNLTV